MFDSEREDPLCLYIAIMILNCLSLTCLTVASKVASNTATRVEVEAVCASTTMLTRVGYTVVNICNSNSDNNDDNHNKQQTSFLKQM
jgi:hypothetical protein